MVDSGPHLFACDGGRPGIFWCWEADVQRFDLLCSVIPVCWQRQSRNKTLDLSTFRAFFRTLCWLAPPFQVVWSSCDVAPEHLRRWRERSRRSLWSMAVFDTSCIICGGYLSDSFCGVPKWLPHLYIKMQQQKPSSERVQLEEPTARMARENKNCVNTHP